MIKLYSAITLIFHDKLSFGQSQFLLGSFCK